MQATKTQAQAMIQAQSPEAAIPLLREAVRKTPRDPELWFLLGIAQGMRADPQAAEQAFRRTVELAPQAFAAWENLGRALMQLGQAGKAERSFRKAIELNPANASAHAGLGELLRARGDYPGSLQALHAALKLEPRSAAVHNQIGATHDLAGAGAEAIRHYSAALQLSPAFYDARLNLAKALRAQGDAGQAVPHFQACTTQNPQSLPGWFGLADGLLELNRWREAVEIYQHILSLDAGMHAAHLALARIWMTQGDLDAARKHLDVARGLRPRDDADVCAQAAELAILAGDFEQAREMLALALDAHPDHLALALAEASLAEHLRVPETVIDKLERLRGALPQAPDTLHFALGRLYERAGCHDDAFQAFQSAHARRGLASDLRQHLEQMDRIEEFFTRERLAQLPSAACAEALPVFIVGMPRSGTSLAEQILASHPDVHGAGETTRLWQLVSAMEGQAGQAYPSVLASLDEGDMRKFADEYLEHLRQLAPGARRICDKLPHNFLHLGLIQLLFPRATVIHCRRDPLDTCLSIFTLRFNINHRYARDLEDLGRYYRRYERLMAHWERTLDLNIHTLDYERLIADQASETRKLLEAAGLAWDDACLRFHESGRAVFTPSFDQVRRPLYSSSLQRWQRFEAHLGPLRKGLQQ